ncbi:MAG TPA: amidophosphoribosyltransferase [Oxalobacteraceae bacterium]|nr:amidophosphoribosyltransferase [Oxalobacteraceae bacterium]
MKGNIKEIYGNWDKGYALDKHMLRSTYLGDNEFGRPQFDNERTEVGEAVYQLKYKSQWDQAELLAQAVTEHIVPHLGPIGLVIPMPASRQRAKQPVHAVATTLANKLGVLSFENILLKNYTGQSLKDLHTREEKDKALAGTISLNDQIGGDGKYNALVLDDLFDSGASMEAACAVLRTYAKINKIFVAALTWK